METPYFRCEDCGHEFARTEFMPDIEDDDHVECPQCGGCSVVAAIVAAPLANPPQSAVATLAERARTPLPACNS